MRRLFGPTVATLSCLGAIAAGCPARAEANLSGLWVLATESPTSIPARKRTPRDIAGNLPPLQPAAAKIYEQRLTDSDNGRPYAPLSNNCLTGGMPNVMTDAFLPFQIIQTPGQVTFIFEIFHVFRTIRLDAEHPADFDPNYFGDSVGHWEGDTLVVDTIGISDKTTLDVAGLPHSDAMHLTERFRRTGPNKMEILTTIDDPVTFTKPWTIRTDYKTSEHPLQEYVCENQRNRPTADGHSSFDRK